MLNRLWQKLFLAFAVLSVATLLSLYLLQQRAFQRDFLDYVNRIGVDRLEQASVRIGKRYEEVGDWQRTSIGSPMRLNATSRRVAIGVPTSHMNCARRCRSCVAKSRRCRTGCDR